MSRPCQRSNLNSGLGLNLNRLIKRGFIKPAAYKVTGIRWSNDWDEELASGVIIADMNDIHSAWLRAQSGSVDQKFRLKRRSAILAATSGTFCVHTLPRDARRCGCLRRSSLCIQAGLGPPQRCLWITVHGCDEPRTSRPSQTQQEAL